MTGKMKLIIAGSRDFNDFEFAKETLNKFIGGVSEVVSGTAAGADKIGEKWALYNFIPVKQFPANWEKYGKAAGHKRNAEMAKYADACIVFWDGNSPGTKNMISEAKKNNIPCSVILYKNHKELW